jgi:ribonuclease P protein component
VSGKHFVIFGLPGATPRSRLGITATKRVGTAATRNRIKRLIRDVFRNHRRELHGPVDLVVNVKPTARDETGARLSADLVARLSDLRRRLQP